VPYDRVDIERNDAATDARWPLRYDEILRYHQRACDWLVCGDAVFDAQQIPGLAGSTLVPGLPDGDIRTSSLERWSLPTNFGRRYRSKLRRSRRVRLVLHLNCTRITLGTDGSQVARLETRTLDGKTITVGARHFVLACGGLETTRLLMLSGIGDHSGHLGRWYMAHVEGRIAQAQFSGPPRDTIYGHERDPHGIYVRRRFSFSREFLVRHRLPNVVAWLVNPELADPRHGSGVLSFAHLALASPAGRYFASEGIRASLRKSREHGTPREHAVNVLRDLGPASAFALTFGYKRFLKPGRRAPGFFTYSAANTYPLQYQGEHLPRWDSRVTLDHRVDALGVPRLRTELRIGEPEVEGVVRAHQHIDAYLREHGCGELQYLTEDPRRRVHEQFHGGYHQVGTTRMSAHPRDGVVDPNLAVHGVGNLHVASSSTFVTSSHANSTFMIVVMALRLADHLRTHLTR
jgi:hypothetical protein